MKLTQDNAAFEEIGEAYLKKIHFFLAYCYDRLGDARNRDMAVLRCGVD